MTFVRQLRLLGLRPRCEACRTGGHGVTIELAHEPGEEIQFDWLELSEAPWGEPAYVLVGALSFSGRCRAVISEGMSFAHLIDAIDGVLRRLGGTAPAWRTHRMAAVVYVTRSWWRTAPVASLGQAEADLDRWAAAVSDRRKRRGTTIAELAAQEGLLGLPTITSPAQLQVERVVGRSALVAFEGNRYGVASRGIRGCGCTMKTILRGRSSRSGHTPRHARLTTETKAVRNDIPNTSTSKAPRHRLTSSVVDPSLHGRAWAQSSRLPAADKASSAVRRHGRRRSLVFPQPPSGNSM